MRSVHPRESRRVGWASTFGASLYDDPAAYAKSSAINFIKHAKTPALALVGERDEECPVPQSFEYWHALKTLGVPATLVVTPTRVPTSPARPIRKTSCDARWTGSQSTFRPLRVIEAKFSCLQAQQPADRGLSRSA